MVSAKNFKTDFSKKFSAHGVLQYLYPPYSKLLLLHNKHNVSSNFSGTEVPFPGFTDFIFKIIQNMSLMLLHYATLENVLKYTIIKHMTYAMPYTQVMSKSDHTQSIRKILNINYSLVMFKHNASI